MGLKLVCACDVCGTELSMACNATAQGYKIARLKALATSKGWSVQYDSRYPEINMAVCHDCTIRRIFGEDMEKGAK